MNDEFKVSIEQEVASIQMRRSHVVVLGAGASRAACPNGDAKGRVLPVMNDFPVVTGLGELFKAWNLDPSKNFEDTFSDLFDSGDTEKIAELQERIEQYFASVVIPEVPTVYDYLILSLRETDLIATFNWDPLLIDAYHRSGRRGLRLPKLAFLHGNIRIGFCAKDKVTGLAGQSCTRCGNPFERSKLLYPVKHKDYATDPCIAEQWRAFKGMLKSAFMITVFGYSGPKTDAEAIDAMKEAWGSVDERSMEQTAFVTRQTEDEVAENWDPFIHSHHYEVTDDFFESWISKHPRRTGEAYTNQYLGVKFIGDNPAPRDVSLEELWAWYARFQDAENSARL